MSKDEDEFELDYYLSQLSVITDYLNSNTVCTALKHRLRHSCTIVFAHYIAIKYALIVCRMVTGSNCEFDGWFFNLFSKYIVQLMGWRRSKGRRIGWYLVLNLISVLFPYRCVVYYFNIFSLLYYRFLLFYFFII